MNTPKTLPSALIAMATLAVGANAMAFDYPGRFLHQTRYLERSAAILHDGFVADLKQSRRWPAKGCDRDFLKVACQLRDDSAALANDIRYGKDPCDIKTRVLEIDRCLDLVEKRSKHANLGCDVKIMLRDAFTAFSSFDRSYQYIAGRAGHTTPPNRGGYAHGRDRNHHPARNTREIHRARPVSREDFWKALYGRSR